MSNYIFSDTLPDNTDDRHYYAESFMVDGKYLEDIVPGYQTLQATGRELLAQEITSQKVGNTGGDAISLVRRPSRVITIKYQLRNRSPDEFRQAFYLLNQVLSGETHKFIFNDDTTKYFDATLQNITEVPGGKLSVISSFTLFVADGMSHATDLKSFFMADDQTITIQNNGNQPTPVNFSAINNAENGYFGFISEKEVIQIGDPTEQDKMAVTETFQAVNHDFLSTAELTAWQANKYKSSYPNGNIAVGSFGVHGGDRGVVQVMYSGGGQVRLKHANNTWMDKYVDKNTAWKAFNFNSIGVLIGSDEWLPYGYCKITISDVLNEGVYAYDKNGVAITSRKFKNGSAWHVTGGYILNGNLYFQVATDQYIRADDTYVGGSAYVADYKSTSEPSMWFGPSIYRAFKTDQFGNATAKNWKLDVATITKYGNVNALGVQELSIVDSTGKAIAGFRFRKIGYGNSVMQLYFFVGKTIIKKWEGNTDWFLKDFSGVITVQKVGADFTFKVNNAQTNVGGTYHYSDDSLATVAGAGVNYWVGAIGTYPHISTELMSVNVATSAEGFKDISNTFQLGDRVDVNADDKRFKNYLNNQPRFDMQALGSEPIIAPVGVSKIMVGCSSFTTSPPLVVATIRERWL